MSDVSEDSGRFPLILKGGAFKRQVCIADRILKKADRRQQMILSAVCIPFIQTESLPRARRVRRQNHMMFGMSLGWLCSPASSIQFLPFLA